MFFVRTDGLIMVDCESSEVKKVYGEILDNFIKICDKNNLNWCLAYGTLLGAIRDEGFIRWDHDVDVFMPYKDYIKLVDIAKDDSLFDENIVFNGYQDMHRQSKVFHLRKVGTTAFINGVPSCRMFIDIFPVFDFNLNDKSKKLAYDILDEIRKNLNVPNEIISKELVIKNNEELFNDFCEFTYDTEGNRVSISLEDLFDGEDITRRLDIARFNKRILPFIDFSKTVIVEFNDTENDVKVPENYEDLLRKSYGNYMIPVRESESKVWTFDLHTDVYEYRNRGQRYD